MDESIANLRIHVPGLSNIQNGASRSNQLTNEGNLAKHVPFGRIAKTI